MNHSKDANMVTLEVHGSPMVVRLGEPAQGFGPGPHTALLLAFHREAFSSFTQEVIDTFSAAGYLIAVPDLYHRSAPAGWEEGYKLRRDDHVLADLDAAFNYLQQRGDVASDRIVMVGHCQGGRIALLAASVWPERFAACLNYYSGGVFESWGDGVIVFDRLNGLRCPVAGFFGLQDIHPAPDEVDRIEAELRRCGVKPQFHRYSDAGHAFMFRESARYRAAAAEDAWRRSFEFLTSLDLQPASPQSV